MTSLNIRHAQLNDAAGIASVYNPYVADTVITFETDPVTPEDMVSRISETLDAGLPWLVTEDDGAIVGYAYASKWKGRCAYRYTVESTVYLASSHQGRGLGRALYTELLSILQGQGMHAVIGGVALPNAASVALHERLGFRKVAHFAQVGFKQDRWIDVGYWQLVFDRP